MIRLFEKILPALWGLGMVFLVIGGGFLFSYCVVEAGLKDEVGPDIYNQVERWTNTCPELSGIVQEKLEHDNKITYREYKEIRRENTECEKKLFKEKLKTKEN